jgi:predicted nucleic acid-binding protein
MIIVSDTSPVSNLILIRRLDILQKVFSELLFRRLLTRKSSLSNNLGKI